MKGFFRVLTLSLLVTSFSLSAALAGVNYPGICGCTASKLYTACNTANPGDELNCAECCQNSAGADEDVPPNCIVCSVFPFGDVTGQVSANCEAACATN